MICIFRLQLSQAFKVPGQQFVMIQVIQYPCYVNKDIYLLCFIKGKSYIKVFSGSVKIAKHTQCGSLKEEYLIIADFYFLYHLGYFQHIQGPSLIDEYLCLLYLD